ncbi:MULTISPECIES: GFA family protein [Citrobacter]|uniref:GFA family protein n=1 Tax=Citrobacter TaxID=544 RepID=UPI0008DCD18F|nr:MULTISPECIES: GFA family protein [Citrobacter]MBE0023876.1 GFA family protein [Citrobacter koseri]MBE0083006.1 GFA family protein [Citrobacter koseri]MBJ8808682.1 GFA family protein [Citrobacter koseri]MBJ9343531.1 GFA family protein [Citrobacter koseri]MDM2965412.1 GFA family protein [Citrobacter sp. CK201]
MTLVEGGCLCGAVRYRMKTPPRSVVVCHCTHCQKASGSAFSVNLLVEKSDYEQQGVTACFTDTGDSGLPSHRHFCRECGSPVVTEATNMPGMLLIKAGTLDNPGEFSPQAEIYTRYAVKWHAPIAGCVRFVQAPVA